MTHHYLRLVLLPLVIFTAALLLVHTQPYDDHELRQLLLPEGCPAPCFMGIRPGVTTMDEAVKLLNDSPWIGEIYKRVINSNSGFITWTWKDQKPSWASRKVRGEVYVTDKKVHAITISSEAVLGETRLTLGMPDREFVSVPQDPNDKSILYEAFYNQYGLITRSWQTCGGMEPLRKTVVITFIEATRDSPRYINSLDDLFRSC